MPYQRYNLRSGYKRPAYARKWRAPQAGTATRAGVAAAKVARLEREVKKLQVTAKPVVRSVELNGDCKTADGYRGLEVFSNGLHQHCAFLRIPVTEAVPSSQPVNEAGMTTPWDKAWRVDTNCIIHSVTVQVEIECARELEFFGIVYPASRSLDLPDIGVMSAPVPFSFPARLVAQQDVNLDHADGPFDARVQTVVDPGIGGAVRKMAVVSSDGSYFTAKLANTGARPQSGLELTIDGKKVLGRGKRSSRVRVAHAYLSAGPNGGAVGGIKGEVFEAGKVHAVRLFCPIGKKMKTLPNQGRPMFDAPWEVLLGIRARSRQQDDTYGDRVVGRVNYAKVTVSYS